MKTRQLLIFSCILTFISCTKENSTKQLPMASFTITGSEGFKTFVDNSFTNYSENALTFNWDFGDGTFSNEENPIHSYKSSGNFIVKLVASNENGTDTSEQILKIGEYSNGYAYYNGTFYNLNSCTIEHYLIEDYPFTFKIKLKNEINNSIDLFPFIEVNGEGEFKKGIYELYEIGNKFSINSTDIIDLEQDLTARINVINPSDTIEIRITANGLWVYYKGFAIEGYYNSDDGI